MQLRSQLIIFYLEMSIKKINGYLVNMSSILGKGSYGEVFRGEHETTKRPCAVKMINKRTVQSDYLKNALISEIQILQLVKSQNIVEVFEVMESSNNYYIIQELCDGDLQTVLRDKTFFNEGDAIKILKQICNGFLALAKEGILHRDLKPANILISKGEVKIGDFGFAKNNIHKNMKNASNVGTPIYMPIQILKSHPYTSKCDVWAVGVIFYELLHGTTPWTANSIIELGNNIQKKPLVIKETLSANAKTFLRMALAITEKDRMSWDDLFVHPIFDNEFEKYAKINKQFEDKLKSVMSMLRFKINSENIDVEKLLAILGFTNQNQLSFEEFHEFLFHICPGISKDEVRYVFEKVDEDASGTISIEEIEKTMQSNMIQKKSEEKNGSGCKRALTMDADYDVQTTQDNSLSNQLRQKVKNCFQKLYKVLSYKNLSLFKAFNAYDTDRTKKLNEKEFKKMITRLDSTFTDEDFKAVFNYIDSDNSNSIEYDELSEVYCELNGIPKHMEQAEHQQKAQE